MTEYTHLLRTPEPLRSILLTDRQWPRHLRIAHARMAERNATDPAIKKLWRDVLKANELAHER